MSQPAARTRGISGRGAPRALAIGLLGLLLLSSLGCPKAKGPTGPRVVTGEAARAYPLLARLPDKLTYLLIADRLDNAAVLLRDSLPLTMLDTPISESIIKQGVKLALGFDPFSPAGLAEAGLAVDGNAALYSTGVFPTLVFPVRDPAAVSATIERLVGKRTVVVSEHREAHVTRLSEDGAVIVLAVLPDLLAIHIGAEGIEPPTAWLDELLDAHAAADPDLDWALAQAGGRRNGLGLVKPAALLHAWHAVLGALGESPSPACLARGAVEAAAFGRVALYGRFASGEADGGMFVELAPSAYAALTGHIAPPPGASLRKARAQAAYELAFGLDLDWLAGVLAGVAGQADCDDPIDALNASRLHNLPGIDGFDVIVSRADAAGEGVAAEGMAWLSVSDAEAARATWEEIGPHGELANVEIEGVAAQSVTVPDLASPVESVIGPTAIRVGVGKQVLRGLLSDAPAVESSAEILFLSARPDQTPDMKPTFLVFRQLIGFDPSLAEVAAIMLARYHELALSAVAVDGGIRVAAGFRLR
jgi:hypothetical protein